MILRPTFRLPFHPASVTVQKRTAAVGFSRARVDGKPVRLRNMRRRTQDPIRRQKRHHQKKWLEAIGVRFTGDDAAKAPTSPPPPTQNSALEQLRKVDPVPENADEAYAVERTPSGNLPVYQLRKRGGNLLQTRIRKLEGRTEVLRKQLWEFLVPQPEWLKINAVNGHIEMKGFYKDQVDRFLISKGF